jgi:hypothetical protein
VSTVFLFVILDSIRMNVARQISAAVGDRAKNPLGSRHPLELAMFGMTGSEKALAGMIVTPGRAIRSPDRITILY